MKLLTVTFVILVSVFVLPAKAEISEPILIGQGGSPEWSPSGDRLAIRSRNLLKVYDIHSLEQIAEIDFGKAWLFRWYSEDTIAVFYKEYIKEEGKKIGQLDRNGLFDLQGNYSEIARDTVLSSDRSKTIDMRPWVRLPDGTVGFYYSEGEHVRKFKKLVDGQLVQAEPDTSKAVACNDKFKHLRSSYKYHIAPNCALAFVFREPDHVAVIIDTLGEELLEIGPKARRYSDTTFLCISLPRWSPTSKYLTYTTVIEDGHYGYGTSLYIVNHAANEIILLEDSEEDVAYEVSWSPTRDMFVYTGGGTGTTTLRIISE